MQRRSLLLGLGGLFVAPAIVRADSLMRIVPRDDTAYLQGLIDRGIPVLDGNFVVRGPILMRNGAHIQRCRIVREGPCGPVLVIPCRDSRADRVLVPADVYLGECHITGNGGSAIEFKR